MDDPPPVVLSIASKFRVYWDLHLMLHYDYCYCSCCCFWIVLVFASWGISATASPGASTTTRPIWRKRSSVLLAMEESQQNRGFEV